MTSGLTSTSRQLQSSVDGPCSTLPPHRTGPNHHSQLDLQSRPLYIPIMSSSSYHPSPPPPLRLPSTPPPLTIRPQTFQTFKIKLPDHISKTYAKSPPPAPKAAAARSPQLPQTSTHAPTPAPTPASKDITKLRPHRTIDRYIGAAGARGRANGKMVLTRRRRSSSRLTPPPHRDRSGFRRRSASPERDRTRSRSPPGYRRIRSPVPRGRSRSPVRRARSPSTARRGRSPRPRSRSPMRRARSRTPGQHDNFHRSPSPRRGEYYRTARRGEEYRTPRHEEYLSRTRGSPGIDSTRLDRYIPSSRRIEMNKAYDHYTPGRRSRFPSPYDSHVLGNSGGRGREPLRSVSPTNRYPPGRSPSRAYQRRYNDLEPRPTNHARFLQRPARTPSCISQNSYERGHRTLNTISGYKRVAAKATETKYPDSKELRHPLPPRPGSVGKHVDADGIHESEMAMHSPTKDRVFSEGRDLQMEYKSLEEAPPPTPAFVLPF